MIVPQRMVFGTVTTDGPHTVSFGWEYTRAGIHAYDFIATVDPSQNGGLGYIQGVTGNPAFTPGITDIKACANLGGVDEAICEALVEHNDGVADAPDDFIVIPHDLFDSKDSAPAAGTGTTQKKKEQAFEDATSGDPYGGVFLFSLCPGESSTALPR